MEEFYPTPSTTSFPSQQSFGVSKHSLRPVTIRQILRTHFEEGRLSSIEGVEFQSVTLVASVISVDLAAVSRQRKYTLEDGSGRIVAWQWLPMNEDGDPVSDEPGVADVRPNTYVRVYGSPSKYMTYISLKLDHLRPINDIHEVYFHTMESILTTLQYTRGPPPRIYESSSARGQVRELSASFRSLSVQSSAPCVASSASAFRSSPLASSPSPSPSLAPSIDTEASDDPRDQSTDDVPSEDSLEYVSASERDDDDDSDSDNNELGVLRSELEAPSAPPSHTHHALCRCQDRLGDLSSSLSSASESISAITSTRHLRRDPYSQWTSLERNIILYIQEHQSEDDTGVDIYLIGKAASITNPSQATPDTVDTAIDRLLHEHVIEETIDDTHFRLARSESTYPVLL